MPQPGEDLEFNLNVVDAKYFRALGTPLLSGRDFSEQDTASTGKVMIVNEALARRFWPGPSGREAVGQRVTLPGTPEPYEIIGVVKTGKYRALREAPLPFMYLPLSQSYRARLTLFIRMAGQSRLLLSTLRAEVRKLDQAVPLFEVETLEEHLGRALGQERTNAWLIGSFALLALLLAAVGLYGVMSYAVTQRTREIGIRLALGASPRAVFKLVVGQGMMVTLIGLLIGLGAALALTRVVEKFLYHVSVTDPLTFAVIALLLTLVALLACLIPARQATKVDPMIALRCE